MVESIHSVDAGTGDEMRCFEGSLSLGGAAKEISKNHISKYNCGCVRDMWGCGDSKVSRSNAEAVT